MVILAGYAAVRGFHHYLFPFGSSHCCIVGLGFELSNYAEAHGGFFPRGEASPEASLSLLWHDRVAAGIDAGIMAELLRGKTVPVDVVSARLASGGLLDPETCGWHYVEGLTLGDNPEIAILWDKVGLGHNGLRLWGGGHEVFFLGGTHRIVPAAEWPEFFDRQEKLLVARTDPARQSRPLLAARVRLPDGELVDRYEGPFELSIAESDASGGSGTHTSSGPVLSAENLRWYDFGHRNADGTPVDSTLRITLLLGAMKSRPVEVTVWGGVATPDSVVFEMQNGE